MKYSWIGILVGIFLVFLPFFFSSEILYGTANAKFFWVIGLAVTTFVIAGVQLLKNGEAQFTKSFWLPAALVLVLGLHIVSAYTGVFPERSWWSDILRATGVLYLVHIFTFGLLVGLFAQKTDWSIIRRGLVLGGGLFALGTIVGVGGLGYEGGFLGLPFRQEGFVFGNSTFAGTYLVLVVMLGLIELLHSWSTPRWRNILLGGIFLILASPTLLNIREFVLSGGDPLALMGAARTSSVTIYTFLVFFAGWFALGHSIFTKVRGWLRTIWASLFLLGISIGIALLFVPGSFVQKQYVDLSSAARIIVWESGVEAVQDKPVFGWGPENFNQAFEAHHDSRLYLKENLAEIWFDRAHNVFVDTLVSLGWAGILGISVVLIIFGIIVVRAFRKGVISSLEAVLLLALVPVHVTQLQTGFDTLGSYLVLALIFGYGVYLEQVGSITKITLPSYVARSLGVLLLIGAVVSAWFILGQEQIRQHALRDVFRAESISQEHELIRESLTRLSDFESIRVTSDSFLSGGLDEIGRTQSPEVAARIMKTIPLYEEAWKSYIDVQPNHYRARINLAYLLLVKTVLGEPSLDEVDRHIAKAYELSPGNPLTYIVDGLAHLYRGDLDGAQDRIDAAVAIDPDIRLSQAVAEYLEVQRAEFPQITLFRLESI